MERTVERLRVTLAGLYFLNLNFRRVADISALPENMTLGTI
jgi:hypothetical protein